MNNNDKNIEIKFKGFLLFSSFLSISIKPVKLVCLYKVRII